MVRASIYLIHPFSTSPQNYKRTKTIKKQTQEMGKKEIRNN
jgi:hypothetical protein